MDQAFASGHDNGRARGGLRLLRDWEGPVAKGWASAASWEPPEILAWQTLSTFLLGWGVLAGKQS